MKTNRLLVAALSIFLVSITAFAQAKKPISKTGLVKAVKISGISYYDIGDRKAKNALVFIHGWTCNADFWKESLREFPNYRVLALDLPGHGKSDKPQATYSMEYFAKAVETVMNDAGVKKAVLVGHSMGTPVAREFYRMHPDRTLGIVIVDGAVKAYADEEKMKGYMAPLRENYAANMPKFLEFMLASVQDQQLKETVRSSMSSTPGYVAISAWEGMADAKIWRDDKIEVPVLAIMAKSPFWPPNVKDFYTAVAPKLDFQMWDGVSHFLMMEKPQEFNAAVKSFIEKNNLL